MSARFEELDWRETPMGEISLRRRREPTLDVDVFEAKLGDEFLMSSLFTVAEIELSRLGLAAVHGDGLDVLVGGLGLGYTAVAALEDPRVARLTVVEALPEVVGWHEAGLLPVSARADGGPAHAAGHGRLLHHRRRGTAPGPGGPGPPVRRPARRHRPQPPARAAPEPRGLLQRGRPAPDEEAAEAPRRLRALVRRPHRTTTSPGCSRPSSQPWPRTWSRSTTS